MSSTDENKSVLVDEKCLDILREVGNSGAGNATTALAQIVNCKIDMEVPKARILNFNELSDILGGPDTPVIGILFELSQDINGMRVVAWSLESAKQLMKGLLGQEPGD